MYKYMQASVQILHTAQLHLWVHTGISPDLPYSTFSISALSASGLVPDPHRPTRLPCRSTRNLVKFLRVSLSLPNPAMHDAPLDRRDALALGVLHLEPCKDVVHVLAIDLGLDSQQIPCTSSLPPLTFCIRGKVTPWLSYASACTPIGMGAAYLAE